jgi:hypothetical protein
MNTFIRIGFLALIFLASCKKDDTNILTVSRESIEIHGEGGSVTFHSKWD